MLLHYISYNSTENQSQHLWIHKFQADQNLLSSVSSVSSSPLTCNVFCGKKKLTFLRVFDFPFACIMPVLTTASSVHVRNWILWQTQVLQYTNRTVIILMKSLPGDSIKHLAKWQITEASERNARKLAYMHKDRKPITVSLSGMKQWIQMQSCLL